MKQTNKQTNKQKVALGGGFGGDIMCWWDGMTRCWSRRRFIVKRCTMPRPRSTSPLMPMTVSLSHISSHAHDRLPLPHPPNAHDHLPLSHPPNAHDSLSHIPPMPVAYHTNIPTSPIRNRFERQSQILRARLQTTREVSLPFGARELSQALY